MVDERRKSEPPIPENVEELLNEAQKHTIQNIEKFGWTLKFVRRPLFQDPVPVVYNSDGTTIGVINKDGILDLETEIKLRD